MERILKRILIIYLSALLTLCVSVGVSMVLKNRAAVQLQQDARTINTSGRQRMLSQRIIYLAQDLSLHPDPATQAELEAAIGEFEAAIDLFERSHNSLSLAPDMSPELSALYFDPGAAQSLDARIRNYIAAARRIVQDPRDADSLEILRSIETAGFLADINAVVDAYEKASIARIDLLTRWEWIALLVALGIVLVEVLLVFLPGHKYLSSSMAALSRRNSALAAARREMEAKQKSLEESLRQSERLRAEQAEFTYAVSHDLKSPANSMQMFLSELELGNADQLDEDGKELLGMCQATAMRMATQVEDILGYARVTEGGAELERFDLAEVAQEVRGNLEALIRETGAALEIDVLPQFSGYRTQMRVLMQNLIENALKYRAPDRAPIITVSATISEADGHLCLSVSDNGIGIAPEHHERIFKMFQRLHLRDIYAGSGLGLSTCMRVARNHGGSIHVDSALGTGTTFRVDLPQIEVTQTHHKEAA